MSTNRWSFVIDESSDGRFIRIDLVGDPIIYDTREALQDAVKEDLADYFDIIDAGLEADDD